MYSPGGEKSRCRSAITNGRDLLADVDGRSGTARRYRDVECTNRGRPRRPLEAQLQLIRSAAGLIVTREGLDTKAVNGEQIDVSTYCRISNSLRRVLDTIDLRRVPKDITPNLDTYLAAKRREADDADYVEADA